jgi:hypothetical protein
VPAKPTSEAFRKASASAAVHVAASNTAWIVRKTSLQGNRMVLNDDFALNLKRKSSFGGSQQQLHRHKTSTAKPMSATKAAVMSASTGNLDKAGLEVKEFREFDEDVYLHRKGEKQKSDFRSSNNHADE